MQRKDPADLAGFGLGLVMEDQVAAHVAAGRLVRVMDDWRPAFAGYHLYFPSRRQLSAAFTLLLETLRDRPSAPYPTADLRGSPMSSLIAGGMMSQARAEASSAQEHA
jgi:hypothetical protein